MGLASPPVPNPRPVQRASQVCLLGRRYRLSSRLGVALRRNRFSQRRNLDETIGCYRSCLKLCRSDMELGTFEKGYIAGWRSVRGPKDLPPNVPASPMRIPAGSLHGRLLSRPKRRDCHGRDPRFGKLECPRGCGAIRILTCGPGSSLGFPDPKPPSDKKRIASHAGHR
jgi:hypothetical protein